MGISESAFRDNLYYARPYLEHMYLIVVDTYSKWTGVMRTSTAAATIEKVRGIFATHGLPVMVVSNNGPCFTSQDFKIFMKVNGIQHIFTPAYHSSSNG